MNNIYSFLTQKENNIEFVNLMLDSSFTEMTQTRDMIKSNSFSTFGDEYTYFVKYLISMQRFKRNRLCKNRNCQYQESILMNEISFYIREYGIVFCLDDLEEIVENTKINEELE